MKTPTQINTLESPVSTKRKTHGRRTLLGGVSIAIAAVGTLAVSGCTKHEVTATHEQPRAVRVYHVGATQTSTIRALQFTGVVRARTESSVGFRVGGKVSARLVNAGETVKAGQLLFTLDATDYQLALGAAQAVKKQAALELERVRILVEKRAESRDALERASAAADTSAAQVEQLSNQVNYTTLVADTDGVVMSTLAEPGQVVAPGQPVLLLAKDGQREAVVDIPENSLENLRGGNATASLYLNSERVVPATFREISGVADPVARTYQARYILVGEAERFPLGATVTVRIERGAEGAQHTYEVPLGSLIDRGEGTAVWVVDPQTSTIVRRPVVLAKIGAETASVREGLRPDDLVVALGAQLLHDGEHVKAANASAKEVK